MAQTIEIDGTKFIVTHPIGTRIEWTDRVGSVRRGRVAGLAYASMQSGPGYYAQPDDAPVEQETPGCIAFGRRATEHRVGVDDVRVIEE